MKWEGNRQSDNIEDRRGQGMGGGGGVRLGGGRGIGLGTIVIALIAGWIFGINPLTVLGILGGGGAAAPQAQVQQAPAQRPPKDDAMAAMVGSVLADTEDVWGEIFKQAGVQYPQPKLTLFRGQTQTACGAGQAAMGPFYCPADRKVYIDLGFYETMRTRLGAPGDFAQAYVIAHEVGHHVQNLMGTTGKLDQMRGRIPVREQNALSVRLELQADCYAGVWAHHTEKKYRAQGKQWLEKGDVEEALNAAQAIGDDALQKKSQGQIVPDSFTHGTSQQRMRWFAQGFQTGQVKACDTFNAKQL
jgi:predicted metalloprotease